MVPTRWVRPAPYHPVHASLPRKPNGPFGLATTPDGGLGGASGSGSGGGGDGAPWPHMHDLGVISRPFPLPSSRPFRIGEGATPGHRRAASFTATSSTASTSNHAPSAAVAVATGVGRNASAVAVARASAATPRLRFLFGLRRLFTGLLPRCNASYTSASAASSGSSLSEKMWDSLSQTMVDVSTKVVPSTKSVISVPSESIVPVRVRRLPELAISSPSPSLSPSLRV
mmetsp:Transcript_5602/g.12906  ORF Transcript_5602/g.12906 Transcript_5602/m.12906 type:complete len:228 (-) Transcript_5602:2338-3021(-)